MFPLSEENTMLSTATAPSDNVLTERRSIKSQEGPESSVKDEIALKEITREGDGSASFEAQEKGSITDEKAVGMDEALVDDPAIYTVTVRACIVGTCVAVFGASVAQVE